MNSEAKVTAVSLRKSRKFGKDNQNSILLVKNLGVEGDSHFGENNMHLYAMKNYPPQPNLRQVHLMHTELFDELAEDGFTVLAGQMGENITTAGVDILHLPENTILKLGKSAEIKITGLREPCSKLNTIQKGLLNKMVVKDEEGKPFYKSGVMSVVVKGGKVKVGDKIEIVYPKKPFKKLEAV